VKPILLTGASGYEGGRLLEALEVGGYAIRCLVRQPSYPAGRAQKRTTVVQGDCLDPVSRWDGIDVALYLVHSMGSKGNLAERDRAAAERFGRECARPSRAMTAGRAYD